METIAPSPWARFHRALPIASFHIFSRSFACASRAVPMICYVASSHSSTLHGLLVRSLIQIPVFE